jgi:hypothetical protein
MTISGGFSISGHFSELSPEAPTPKLRAGAPERMTWMCAVKSVVFARIE